MTKKEIKIKVNHLFDTINNNSVRKINKLLTNLDTEEEKFEPEFRINKVQ